MFVRLPITTTTDIHPSRKKDRANRSIPFITTSQQNYSFSFVTKFMADRRIFIYSSTIAFAIKLIIIFKHKTVRKAIYNNRLLSFIVVVCILF